MTVHNVLREDFWGFAPKRLKKQGKRRPEDKETKIQGARSLHAPRKPISASRLLEEYLERRAEGDWGKGIAFALRRARCCSLQRAYIAEGPMTELIRSLDQDQ